MALAVGLFYTVFFTFAPWLTEGIPQEGYGVIITKIIYVLVAYFGGVAVPIGIFFCGVAITFS
jgi:hypothetical protein